MKKLLVTAALPYSNGRPHVGHLAGCYLPCDTYVRYKRLNGVDVKFICGSDDHGVAIQLSAEKEGKTPAELSAYYNTIQDRDLRALGVSFDVFGATSQTKYHKPLCQEFFLSLHDKGLLHKETSRQFYDESKEMFLPDRFVTGTCDYCKTPDQNGDQCENCGKVLDVDTLLDPISVTSKSPAVIRETTHWFLDLSQFEGVVKDWLDSAELRDQTKNFVSGLLGAGLVKRSMTRDLDWGIPVPLKDSDAAGKVLYVWFDAPIGYISNTSQLLEERGGKPEEFSDWWKSQDCEIVHFIGEDNTIFHCVIWIAMLKAEGSYTLPKAVVVNQFLNIQFPGKEEEKISKSRGNAVWLGDFLEKGGNPDALRYYLTAIATEKARTAYQPEALVQRNNTDLANVIGNFVNRIVSFTHKYVGESVPEYDRDLLQEVDKEFLASFAKTKVEVGDLIERYQFKQGLEVAMDFVRACNKYVDDKAPWKSRKDDMPGTLVTLNISLQAISFIRTLLKPYMPFTMEKIDQILPASETISWDDADRELPAGTPITEPVILFEKMELADWVEGEGV